MTRIGVPSDSDWIPLRAPREDDLDAIGALQEAAILAQGVPFYGIKRTRVWARVGHQFRHHVLGEGEFWVADRTPDPAGRRPADAIPLLAVGGWSPDPDEADLAWIRFMFVHPNAGRRGLGRRIVVLAEESARQAGRPRLHLYASLNAVGFYDALDYARVRKVRWPLDGRYDIDYVLMAKEPDCQDQRADGVAG